MNGLVTALYNSPLNLWSDVRSNHAQARAVMSDLIKFSDIVVRIAVPFFGGFLGGLGVVLVGYLLGVIGIPQFIGLTPQFHTQQSIQNTSWGGAMWGFIPAVFLIARRGNIYAVVLLTTFIAVSYGLFVLQGLPITLTIQIIYRYLVNLSYTIILSATIRASGLTK